MFYLFEIVWWKRGKCSGGEKFLDIGVLMNSDQQWVESSLNEVELYTYVSHSVKLSQKYCILGKTELIWIPKRHQKTKEDKY